MFGMLDYRAHKLYVILFFIPNIFLTLFALFGIPLINYSIGLQFADERIYQILLSLVALIVVEFLWLIIVLTLINNMFKFIFELFVDLIPHDGRTKEEAQLVAWGGDKAIRSLKINKHPSEWSESLITEIPKNDWVANLFYRDEIIKRFKIIYDEYLAMSTYTAYTDAEVERIMTDHNLKISWREKIFTNPQYRKMLIGYSFFFYLLLFNPFG